MKNISDKRVWVIDDDLSILEVIKIVLEEAGYDVVPISDIRIFNKKIKTERPDLILLDIWMSGQNGHEIAEFLKSKETTKGISIVMISALSDCKSIAKECGADGFLRKPFDMYELLDVVKKYSNNEIQKSKFKSQN